MRRWFLLVLALGLLVGCGEERVFDNPLVEDGDGDGAVVAYECDDADPNRTGLCSYGEPCELNTQCVTELCLQGSCACEGNWAGDSCATCDPHWADFAGSPESDCHTCANQWTGGKCDVCPLNWTGEDCDTCSNGWIGAECDVCQSHWDGENCDICSDNWTGEACDTCSNAWEGNYCKVCPDDWAGKDCDTCAINGPQEACGEVPIDNVPMSCAAWSDSGLANSDGNYWIDPAGPIGPFVAYCDMTTDGGGWTLIAQGGSLSCSSATATADMLDSTTCSYLQYGKVAALAQSSSDVRLQVSFSADEFGAWAETSISTNHKAIEALMSPSGNWHNGATFSDWDWGVGCGELQSPGWPNMYYAGCNAGGVHWLNSLSDDCNSTFHDWNGGCETDSKSQRSATWIR